MQLCLYTMHIVMPINDEHAAMSIYKEHYIQSCLYTMDITVKSIHNENTVMLIHNEHTVMPIHRGNYSHVYTQWT